MIEGYSQVHQTVSEIGEMDSPARVPFTAMLLAVALLLLVFAASLRRISVRAEIFPLAAYLTGCMALSAIGVGLFAFPHPLHNFFGLSELVGYQAPLAMAVTFRRDRRFAALVRLSFIMSALVWLAILLNLATLDRGGAIFAYERPIYGLVQRSLFLAWFVWCAAAGLLLFRDPGTGRFEGAGTPARRSNF
jgi:hypothetical membrane protein